MSGIKDYSTTASNNNSSVPNGWPEGMAPSGVNDCGRQMMADIRAWYEDAQWVNLGHIPTRTGNTTFTVSGNKTADYTTGRRIKCTDITTIYATITSSSYSAPNTTVTIHSDAAGNLSASLSAVSVGILTPIDSALIANIGRKGSDIASATTTDLSTTTGDFVDVTGTTTITALGSLFAGVQRIVRFRGALTLTHNGTSLILPGSANITTADGDIAIFKSLGSGNWVCVSYLKGAVPPLSAYAQGTYTPTVTLTGGSGNTTPVYSTNVGRYTKIGNRVHVWVDLNGDGGNEGAGTGRIDISLPISPTIFGGFFVCGAAYNSSTGYHLVGTLNSSNVQLSYIDTSGNVQNFSAANQNNASRAISLNFKYEV
jgi:hypothetical protein